METDTLQTPAAPPRSGGGWGTTLLFLGTLAVYFAVTQSSAPAGWGDDFDVALAEASRTDRNMVVAFHMKGCPPCSAMDREVLGASEVQSALSKFIPVRMDVTKNPELANRLGVFGTPTYAVLDPHGTLLASCSGYQPAGEFVNFLNRATERATTARAQAAPAQPSVP